MPHCPRCNSERPGETCWKCDTPTIEPCAGWEYPKLPDVDRIRELAKEVGYAVGVHGSQQGDLDLIAAPWVEDAVGPLALMQHVASGINARVVEVEQKPLGRIAASIQIDGYYKIIDLSVCPSVPLETTRAECTDDDSWNCKYCTKTKTCLALKDPRNFGSTNSSSKPSKDSD